MLLADPDVIVTIAMATARRRRRKFSARGLAGDDRRPKRNHSQPAGQRARVSRSAGLHGACRLFRLYPEAIAKMTRRNAPTGAEEELPSSVSETNANGKRDGFRTGELVLFALATLAVMALFRSVSAV
ncbi:MAG: hypothetical protein R2912_09210 [Eubacteriales bacterium]